MSTHMTWPDRSTFQSCVLNPAQHFDDPELSSATFERGRMGMPQVWSGGRAMVVKANRPANRSTAVRFLMRDDREAGVRYEALSRHLSRNPVPTMVAARWVDGGLKIGDQRYPILKMDWVDGLALDRFIDRYVDACRAANTPPVDLTVLADAWRESCRSMLASGMSHGDIHAGNTLVWSSRPGVVELRLVDYDNAWVPDLHTPSYEAGHPAFQHPDRPAVQRGPYQDAFPNTLTYLSLIGLVHDPGLWTRYHLHTDDGLLFEPSDLRSPTTDTWTALLNSTDAQVRGLATATHQWLHGAPGMYQSLEHALAAVRPQPVIPAPVTPALNVWPPVRPDGHVGPRPGGTAQPAFGQSWPAQQAWRSGQSAPTPPPGPRPTAATAATTGTAPAPPTPVNRQMSAKGGKGRWILALLLLIAVLAAIAYVQAHPS